jgi:hypothetical protein
MHFYVGEDILETVDRYKYLGVFLIKGIFHCGVLAKAAGLTLGNSINKLWIKSFTKLFEWYQS